MFAFHQLLNSNSTTPAMAVKFTITTLIFFCAIAINLSTTTSSNDPCASQPDNSDLMVIPKYGKCSPFKSNFNSWIWPKTIMDMASKDLERVEYLSSLVAQNPPSNDLIALGQAFHVSNYVVQVKLGTPGQLMFMVLDTSLDEAWVPCTGPPSNSTIFTPKVSTTYAGPINCSSPICSQVRGSISCPSLGTASCFFNQSYAASNISAVLIQDSLTLAADTVKNFAFGCVISVSGGSIPSQGLLGLGRGPLSLLSQTVPYYNGVFSYCLPCFNSSYFSGSLKLGSADQPNEIPTTPLLRNSLRPSLYYVNLTGITVGQVHVAFSSEYLAFDPNTGSGTIIDSGTIVTRFVEPVYSAIRNEFRGQVKGPFMSIGEFDTCFVKKYETLAPLIKLHFTDLNLTLPFENIIMDSSGSLACLAMAARPNNTNFFLNVIGNFQQQNLRILFDTVNNKVGIGRESCN